MLAKLKYFILWVVAILLSTTIYAQHYDTGSIFRMPIVLDTLTIKSSFDAKGFISRVQNDTTFYKAFKNMRLVPYTATNEIYVYDKKGKVEAGLTSKTMQQINKNCRQTKVITEKTEGKFYKKNGEYIYYTASLYDYLFFAHHPICGQTDIVAGSMDNTGATQIEKNEYQLKQLIFNPGSKIKGIPFMGNKASIFDEDERIKYNYKLKLDTIDNQECYVFSITPKPEYKNKVVYNELITWFRKSDYAILARNYSLSYNTLFYDFDVTMKVRTTLFNNKLYPTLIQYDGNWHIFTKKRERVKFKILIDY